MIEAARSLVPHPRPAQNAGEAVPVTPFPQPSAAPRQPFQLGYATTDIEQARVVFAEDLGITDFLVRPPAVVDVATPAGSRRMELLLAFAFLGETQIELIQPLSG